MSDSGVEGFLGLGSNQGDREQHLRSGLASLGAGGVSVTAVSTLYETDPFGEYAGAQPDYLNAVARVRTRLSPADLLRLCKEIEVGRGRDLGGPRHGPRPLDIDILLLGELEVSDPELEIPHPGLLERRFVLEPLLELEPGVRTPKGASLVEALERLPEQGVMRLGRRLDPGR